MCCVRNMEIWPGDNIKDDLNSTLDVGSLFGPKTKMAHKFPKSIHENDFCNTLREIEERISFYPWFHEELK